jgi:hypothetical protein
MPYTMGGISLDALDTDELETLAAMLHRGWSAIADVYGYGTYGSYVQNRPDAPAVVEVERDGFRKGPHPMEIEAEYTYIPIGNLLHSRDLGCAWQACSVCEHRSCSYCPTCNPGEIAPNGEAYGDVEDTPAACCH